MRKTALLAALGALALSACTTAYPGSPQAHSGITEATVEKSADGAWRGHIISGKNSGKTSLTVAMPDGTAVTFDGEQIDGATAQAQASAANTAIIGKLIEKIPAVAP